MFGGSSVVVCEGPVLQRGGAWRRINARDCGGEVRRWEKRGSHGHCGGLQSVISSHQRIPERTAVATGTLQPSIPEGLTQSDSTLQGATRASQSSRTLAHVHTWILQL